MLLAEHEHSKKMISIRMTAAKALRFMKSSSFKIEIRDYVCFDGGKRGKFRNL